MDDEDRDSDLAHKWLMQAQEHEIAAREIEESTCDEEGDDESMLHRETAATLRRCAQDLLSS